MIFILIFLLSKLVFQIHIFSVFLTASQSKNHWLDWIKDEIANLIFGDGTLFDPKFKYDLHFDQDVSTLLKTFGGAYLKFGQEKKGNFGLVL